MYQLTADPNCVLDLTDGASVPTDGNSWRSVAYLEWLAAGNTPDPVPAPTFDDLYALFMGKFSAWVLEVANSNNYDSQESCASFDTSSVPQFKADAIAFIAWRDLLWVWAANWQASVNGQIPNPVPKWEDIKAMAPQPEASGWVIHPPGAIIDAQVA